MSKNNYLNIASDFRRAAYFVATGEDDGLVNVLIDELKGKKEITKKLNVDFSLKRNLLAEDLLMASRRIMQSFPL